MKRNGRTAKVPKSTFVHDPFYLYPLKDELIDLMFVDREEEVQIARGLLKTDYKGTVEICAIIGGIGIGKSSMLNHIGALSAGLGHSVSFIKGPDLLGATGTRAPPGPGRSVLIIDDTDKMDDEKAGRFYTELGAQQVSGQLIFFADTYSRSGGTTALRNSTVSHNITLPQRLPNERLGFFLKERMKRCLAFGSDPEAFELPFDESSIEMAAIRSRGNLRNFLNYTKHAWMAAMGQDKQRVGAPELMNGMLSIDRALFGGCDVIDMRILYFTTTGDMNKALLAHRCGVDSRTIDARMNGPLFDVLEDSRAGKETIITSVYRRFPEGEALMKKIITGLGFHMADITGLRE